MSPTGRHLTRRDRLGLWFALATGPALWATQLGAGYLLVIAVCSTGTGTGAVEPVVGVASAAFALIVGAAALAGLRLWRAASREEIADERGRVAFMAAVGGIWSVIFVVLIVMGGVQIVALSPCSAS